jgi:hypothetical protein
MKTTHKAENDTRRFLSVSARYLGLASRNALAYRGRAATLQEADSLSSKLKARNKCHA